MSLSRRVQNVTELVGRTPLQKLERVTAHLRGVEVFAKLEFLNPGGSVKDRPALAMMEDGIASGRLKPGMRVVDSTSGNTGIALAWIGASLGFRVSLVMPENVSVARKRLTGAFGADLLFSSPLEGSDGALRFVRSLVARHPGDFFYPDQYSNPANPLSHQRTTAEEIFEQTHGAVTHFVAGMGTTGTITGTGRGLKAKNPSIQIVGLQPDESLHGLEGLKHLPSSMVPEVYDPGVPDQVRFISTDAGWDMADRLRDQEGLWVGHSSGAAMVGALAVAEALEARGERGVVVTVFPDRADRYFDPVRWPRALAVG